MVSTRPSPTPARGRVAYPSAANYTPGDANNSPAYLSASSPVKEVSSRESDKERAQGLKTWWKGFREREAAGDKQWSDGRVVFGVPLEISTQYASVQLSTSGPDDSLYVWGVIPVVVAKCGLYLKENATTIEGTFRVSGSEKRMRDLQLIFDTGPKYGKDIDWKRLPYTAHDVGTIFRRFLTQMPEPIVPFRYYGAFRLVMEKFTCGETSVDQAIDEYKHLIQSLPDVNRYLLLYVLDLLSVFARRSEINLMTAANLALIFQPGIISHEIHAMQLREHVLSQQVLEFLIEHQKHFVDGVKTASRKSKKKTKAKRSGSRSSSKQTVPAPLVKAADADLMVPSDSDDEAPLGGYYVIEGRIRSPIPVANTTTSPSIEKIASPPPLRPKPTMDALEPSDSDEDVPPGGYEVRSGDFESARATLLARSHRNVAFRTMGESLARRKTVPARVGVGLSSKIRKSAEGTKEAP
ncbi:rho GTPase activator [Cryptococcus neoformans]|nr:hypothetical protein AYX15_06037 [Cryptococcus neoformans var. grubii]OWZ65650.1 hypothetical protein AYX14_06161 [Cryptococcus neoformans var. grubii]OXG15351.1 rho GTPase activator [Cryptococcus neoformans var. grubii Tu401-1]OXH29348.1 rho GTPase activator [Cryptococcus neoformans var. grubii]